MKLKKNATLEGGITYFFFLHFFQEKLIDFDKIMPVP